VDGKQPPRDRGSRSAASGILSGLDPGAVYVGAWQGLLELRFKGRFTAADLVSVRAVEGRRWEPERRSWLLPHVPGTLTALTRAFGSRLFLSQELAGRSGATGHQEPAQAPEAARLGASAEKAESGGSAAPQARGRQGPGVPGGAEPATGCRDPDPPMGTILSGEARVLEALRRAIRTRGYSPKTEKAYLGWVERFFAFIGACGGGSRAVESLAEPDALAFMEHLALSEGLAGRSRNQAASALGFMFREILGQDVMAGVARAKEPRHLPRVLSHREVLCVLRQLVGKYFLIVVLLYSAGLRVSEALRLRIHDIDFELRQIMVRDGKGRKDRYVPLARRAAALLRAQIQRVAEQHRVDLERGHGWSALPDALHRKKPDAGYELGWQYVFPASTLNIDPATGRTGRWPLHVTAVQREVNDAVRASGLVKPATAHTFCHSFATQALRGGCDIRTLQHVMGHKDIRTTMIYLHVLEQSGGHIKSPLDRPDDPEDHEDDPLGLGWSDERIDWDLGAQQWGQTRRPGDRDERRKK
jgi:integron integrase